LYFIGGGFVNPDHQQGADYLVVIVPVERFVEGRILNAVHFVSVLGIHGASSSLEPFGVAAPGGFFVVQVSPPDIVSIPL